MRVKESDFFHKIKCIGKLILRLAGKSHYNIAGELHVGNCGFQQLYAFKCHIGVVSSLHPCENAAAPALHRKMEVRRYRSEMRYLCNEILSEKRRIERTETYSHIGSGYLINIGKEF